MDSPHSRRFKHTRNILQHHTLIDEEILILHPFCYGDIRIS